MTRVDLHVHTTASDGTRTPRKVVELAHSRGLGAIAITDHDTVSGVQEALDRAAQIGLRVIPGVEISAEHDGVQAHILGYLVDHTSPALVKQLERFGRARLRRANQMLKRLRSLDVPLPWDAIAEAAEEGVVGRPHIAKALLDAGHVSSIEEAFGRYLSPGQPAYVPRLKTTPREAIRIIRDAGGVPVLAHPWCIVFILESLVADGLMGLETHYRGYDACQVNRLSRLAQEHGLIRTGGTDFHGLEGEAYSLGEVDVPPGFVADLEALHASLLAS
jgi:3',5'-nucleoside bisphosphate phosphatase